MKRLFTYFKESWRELGKISWPNRKQTTHLTLAVLTFSLVMGVFIGGIDFGFSELVKRVLVKG